VRITTNGAMFGNITTPLPTGVNQVDGAMAAMFKIRK